MDDQNIIGKEFGLLTVERFNPQSGKFVCICACGSQQSAMRHSLETFKVDRCAQCRVAQRYLNSLAPDPQYLRDLTAEQAAHVLSVYAQHLRACARNDVPATPFAHFVGEMKQDPGAFDVVEESEEERWASVTYQRYRQYDQPKELITRF
jgi:hypothetical protein